MGLFSHLRQLRKYAYVPLTMAAQDAMAQQQQQQGGAPGMGQGMDPNAMQGQPMDPAAGQGMPQMPAQGGGIQIVPGPNGEPIDAETGFIVIDEQQGLEQDPNTGIIFNKFTGEFLTPDGQPMDPQEAQAMIEQAMQGQQGDPTAMQGADPAAQMQDPNAQMQDPGMAGQVQDPNATVGPEQASPELDGMLGGGPMIDPNTGLPIDPNTGYYMQPGSEQEAPQQDISEMIPGLEQFMDSTNSAIERQDKTMNRVLHDLSGTRTDMQGLRREIQKMNDNNDTLLARVDNLANLIESAVSGAANGAYPIGE